MTDQPIIQWQTAAFRIDFVLDTNGVICIRHILPVNGAAYDSASPLFKSSELPLVSIKLTGEGNTQSKTAKTLIGSYLSSRLKYVSHQTRSKDGLEELEITNRDEITMIEVTVRLSIYGGLPVLRSSAKVTNRSRESDVTVTQLSSLVIGGLTTQSSRWFDDYTLMTATNSWFREAQWREHTLPSLGIDANGIYELPERHPASQAAFSLQNKGSFSTGSHLPMGLLTSKAHGDSWLWQIEHNGSWRWEIGDYKDSIYLAAGGPTGLDHDWRQILQPGESFETVPVSLARVKGDFEAAFAALTDYRRLIRRSHEDMDRLSVVFNDYMNCLMGDPDEDKVEALVEPAAQLGAEYFVIDAGWYANDSNWWDDVGLWEPSERRFPSGFDKLLKSIRSRGLVPGVWLEPEVVGVRSVVATRLPETAFFQEHGQRVVERGRFQLDYSRSEVREWMDRIIHNLVVNYGVGFFKFDYNIEVVQGTDAEGHCSAGAGQLSHQRAYLSWVQSLFDRYPELVIESCSSGAQRMDYAMLAVHPLQSTSDQQDPTLYAAIAAAVPTAVTPEQSATWAYPQPEWSDELNALSLINALLGRVYLSGHLNKLSKGQLQLMKEGIDVYKIIRQDLKTAHATWPLGLPGWHDDWIALGLVTKAKGTYLAIWRRGGTTEINIKLGTSKNSQEISATLLYPARFDTEYSWDATKDTLGLKLPNTVCARLFHIN
jgi:alpha-galactosidase